VNTGGNRGRVRPPPDPRFHDHLGGQAFSARDPNAGEVRQYRGHFHRLPLVQSTRTARYRESVCQIGAVASTECVPEPISLTSNRRERGAAIAEAVWVLLNHVEAGRRAQFERFAFAVLRPAAERLVSAIPARVRVLAPTRANDDGTYTYVMLPDPVLPGEDYGLAPLLERAHGEERGREHLLAFADALATPQVRYELVQSPWSGARRERSA
jgi:hypothetical protein